MLAYLSVLLDRARGDRGATAVEYGLMVALIAAVIITSVVLLGDNLDTLFGDVAGDVANPPAPAP
ncbi:MAG TPA: Flp family type IVb pilin [Pilimelia sp.]|nr:Flp family type IVb pilin [Pilimelia sp.]